MILETPLDFPELQTTDDLEFMGLSKQVFRDAEGVIRMGWMIHLRTTADFPRKDGVNVACVSGFGIAADYRSAMQLAVRKTRANADARAKELAEAASRRQAEVDRINSFELDLSDLTL